MNTQDIGAIDEQIRRLQQARQFLVGSAAPAGVSLRRGRLKSFKNNGSVAPAATTA